MVVRVWTGGGGSSRWSIARRVSWLCCCCQGKEKVEWDSILDVMVMEVVLFFFGFGEGGELGTGSRRYRYASLGRVVGEMVGRWQRHSL